MGAGPAPSTPTRRPTVRRDGTAAVPAPGTAGARRPPEAPTPTARAAITGAATGPDVRRTVPPTAAARVTGAQTAPGIRTSSRTRPGNSDPNACARGSRRLRRSFARTRTRRPRPFARIIPIRRPLTRATTSRPLSIGGARAPSAPSSGLPHRDRAGGGADINSSHAAVHAGVPHAGRAHSIRRDWWWPSRRSARLGASPATMTVTSTGGRSGPTVAPPAPQHPPASATTAPHHTSTPGSSSHNHRNGAGRGAVSNSPNAAVHHAPHLPP